MRGLNLRVGRNVGSALAQPAALGALDAEALVEVIAAALANQPGRVGAAARTHRLEDAGDLGVGRVLEILGVVVEEAHGRTIIVETLRLLAPAC